MVYNWRQSSLLQEVREAIRLVGRHAAISQSLQISAMQQAHHYRDDVSKFLVHLTRKTRDIEALENLVSILADKQIEARNFHCLFSPKIKTRGFSPVLRSKFKTVCFTETPLHQIKHLTIVEDRRIHLKPYGLVFWKELMLEKGVSPAIYINSFGHKVRNFLLKQFDTAFADVTMWKQLQLNRDHLELVQYFSSINVISEKHNFLWEREWRHHGHFKFDYSDVVAVVAEDAENFIKACEEIIPEETMKWIRRLPIIQPEWGFEEIIERMSMQIWKMRPA